jgi:hypothetical protein
VTELQQKHADKIMKAVNKLNSCLDEASKTGVHGVLNVQGLYLFGNKIGEKLICKIVEWGG